MRPDFRTAGQARGFGLVAAMFLMIVVTLIVIAMARLSTSQHGTNSLAIQQARAYQAARAGLEWGISRVLNDGICETGPVVINTEGSALSEFTVGVACSRSAPYSEGAGTVLLYRLDAKAENGSPDARPDYAYRKLEAVVEQ